MHVEENERKKQKNQLHSLLKFSTTPELLQIQSSIFINWKSLPCLQPSLVSILAICQRPSLKFLRWPRCDKYFSGRKLMRSSLSPRPNSHRGGPQKSFDAFHQVLGCCCCCCNLNGISKGIRSGSQWFTVATSAKSAKALREVLANDPRATLEQVLHRGLALSQNLTESSYQQLAAGG